LKEFAMNKGKNLGRQLLLSIVTVILGIGAFAQEDSTETTKDTVNRTFEIISWTVSPYTGMQNYVDVDTLNTSFQVYEPQHQIGFMPSHLGEMASPSFFFFLDNKSVYAENPYIEGVDYNFLHSSKTQFYNTTLPYTDLEYSQSSEKEQCVNVVHTQNVNKDFNFGFHINHFGSDGYYLMHKMKGRRYGMQTSYLGGKYSLYASVNINKLIQDENHGFRFQHSLDEYLSETNFPVANTTASSETKAKDVWIRQEFNLLRTPNSLDSLHSQQPNYLMSIGNDLHYEKSERMYSDTDLDSTLYKTFVFDSSATDDYLGLTQLNDYFYFKIYKHLKADVSLNARGFAGIEYQNFLNDNYFHQDIQDNRFLNEYVGASGELQIKKSYLSGYFKTFIGGYKIGTSQLKTQFANKYTVKNNKLSLVFDLSFATYRPNVYYESLTLNNFSWDESFSDINEMDYGASFSDSNYGLSLSANGKVVNKALVFTMEDSVHVINQLDADTKLSFTVNKTTELFNFTLINSFFFNTNNEFMHYSIPRIVSRNSLMYSIYLPKKKTTFQIGADAWYNSSYNLPEYAPELGVFLPSKRKESDRNVYLDPFLNVNVQTVRVFVKLSHLNYFLTDTDYYSAYNYLYKKYKIAFGFSWRFTY